MHSGSKEIKQKGALSGAAVFEMAAEPTGIPMAMLGGGFCRWMLVLIAIFSMDQLDNSKSKMCTSEMNLDVYPRMGSTDFAGLAVYNYCMVSDGTYEAARCRSVADHFQVMNEPNTVVQVPKLDFQAVASDYDDSQQDRWWNHDIWCRFMDAKFSSLQEQCLQCLQS